MDTRNFLDCYSKITLCTVLVFFCDLNAFNCHSNAPTKIGTTNDTTNVLSNTFFPLNITNGSSEIFFLHLNLSLFEYESHANERCKVLVKLAKRCDSGLSVLVQVDVGNSLSIYSPSAQWIKIEKDYAVTYERDSWFAIRTLCSNSSIKTFVILLNFSTCCCRGANGNKVHVFFIPNVNGSLVGNGGKVLEGANSNEIVALPTIKIWLVVGIIALFISIAVMIRSFRQRRHRLQQTEEAVFDFRHSRGEFSDCNVPSLASTCGKLTNPFVRCVKVCLKHLNIDFLAENDDEDVVLPKPVSGETRKISYYGTVHMNLSQQKQPIIDDSGEETAPVKSIKIARPKVSLQSRQLSSSM